MFKLDINRNDVLNTKYGRAKINYYGYYVITNCKEDNHGKFLHKLIYEDNYGNISDVLDISFIILVIVWLSMCYFE